MNKNKDEYIQDKYTYLTVYVNKNNREVKRLEKLAKATGLSKSAVVWEAVRRMADAFLIKYD